MVKVFKTILLISLFLPTYLFSQNFTITGKVTNAETGEALMGAIVVITPGENRGSNTDGDGNYTITNLQAGVYSIKVSYVGYDFLKKTINVISNQTVNFALKQVGVLSKEVIVEVNRAKDRETPVAFTDIDQKTINTRISGQDAPLLVKGTPGLYTFSTDGVGNGEAKLLVRGFSQNYVQVLINGIPTNDPESNSVYWSNWGSVSSSAASIQVQRGAGSSLYGSGAFGGSFNIITQDPAAKPFYGINLSLGDPKNTLYGIRLNTGVMADNRLAFAFTLDRKIAEGSRVSGRYEGINYYMSLAYFPTDNQSVKLVLHGAPQEHGYSWSNTVAYFIKYGYKANPAPFLPRSVVNILPINAVTKEANYGIADGKREMVDDNFVNLSHNFYHKPQLELHYTYDFNEKTSLKATFFYSKGRGAGSSMNSLGTVFAVNKDSSITTYLGPEGYVNDTATAINRYLSAAYQRISYSFHQQGGILTNFTTQLTPFLNLTAGLEYRMWTADHPGHFTNLFGKTSLPSAQRYAYVDAAGKINQFNRVVYQGDLDGPDDLGNIFGWNLANDPTYKTQYRNYRGETPQYTVFAQANWIFENLNIMTSLQYVWYKYSLIENMPSENAIGTLLSSADVAAKGITSEGPVGSKFYMKDATNKYYEFNLINQDRSKSFLQPKIGLNYNFTENVNAFANYAHVQRFIDLGVYYNQGRINPDVEDEKSDQIEIGVGYISNNLVSKLNAYYMTWDNKSASINDISKAGQPGYDRNGFRSELVGTSRNIGVEFSLNSNLDPVLPFKGLEARASFTLMDNTWTKILDNVLYDPVTKLKRAFNASALDANGKIDTLFFDELKDKHVASGPQMMLNLGLTYNFSDFYFSLDMNTYGKDYLLDGESYLGVDGTIEQRSGKEYFRPKYDNVLPSRTVIDCGLGYNFNLMGIRGNASLQVLNLFNTEYFASSDRSGLFPGYLRSFRFNITAGF